ncbi:hypothetical protein AVEN_1911-1, partial [Araneus ventricosus]
MIQLKERKYDAGLS